MEYKLQVLLAVVLLAAVIFAALAYKQRDFCMTFMEDVLLRSPPSMRGVAATVKGGGDDYDWAYGRPINTATAVNISGDDSRVVNYVSFPPERIF